MSMLKSFNLIFTIFIVAIFFVYCNSSFAGESDYKVYSWNNLDKAGITSPGERIIFIVDFSNSMNEYLGGKRKIDAALSALKSILPKIPKNIQVGLRVYGYRNGVTMIDACMASKSIVTLGNDNSKRIYSALERITPIGMTPITYSIKQSLKSDFGLWQGKKRIIILTDGGENCDESPCEYALNIVKKREDIKIDVIAFSVDDKNAISQLKCAALVTRGKFYNADTYPKLLESLEDSFNIQKNVEGKIIAK